jgi:hypothetical protein
MEPRRVLVVANRTAATPRLLDEVRARARAGPCTFTLLIPDAADWRTGDWTLEHALPAMREAAGLPVEGIVAGPYPLEAVYDAVRSGEYDEVIVSTLSRDSSRWLEIDLPHRIARITDAPVHHVVPSEIERSLARERARPEPAPPPRRALGPFVGPAG